MLLATNRCLVPEHFNGDVGDGEAFGEQLSPKGPSDLRFAHVDRVDDSWRVALVPEPPVLSVDTLPSHAVFRDLAHHCGQTGRHCLFYIHGYNKPFAESLEQGWLLQQRYGVEVVLFSWPSNSGGVPFVEYRKARRDAQASFGALDALLEKYGRYLHEWLQGTDERTRVACRTTTNLMAHSLGNYLLEHYVLSQAYQAETRLFTNVVLSQADVNASDHVKLDKAGLGQRVYVTVNENDKVLSWSETLNPPRLGRTLAHLDARRATYVDFTSARGVRTKHQLWGEVRNANVTGFFDAVFKGRRGELASGLTRETSSGVYRAD